MRRWTLSVPVGLTKAPIDRKAFPIGPIQEPRDASGWNWGRSGLTIGEEANLVLVFSEIPSLLWLK